MRCDKVIRELSVPTDDRDRVSLAEHLAQCPSCAVWAERAMQFDRLWDATRPAEPTGETWDRVWTEVARAVDESAPAEQKAFKLHAASVNGSAVRIEKSPAPTVRSSGFRTGRLMAIGSLGIAQAAAIFLVVTLSWGPFAKPPTDVVEIEEGQQIVIRIEGPAAHVVDLTPEAMSYGVDDMYLAFNEVEGIANLVVAMEGVTPWQN